MATLAQIMADKKKKADLLAKRAASVAFNTATPMSPGGSKMKNSTQRGGVRKKTPSSLEEDKYFGGINPDIILGKSGKGNPKTVNPYRKSSSMAGGSKMAKSTQSGAMRPKISMAGGGVNKPETASTFKQKNLAANQKAGKDAAPAQAAPKAAAPAAAPKQPKGMTFQQAVRRNVTEEYTKKKMKPKGSLLGLLRKRKG